MSDSAPTGHAGIFRPFPFSQPVTIKATVSPEGSGRYEATFRIRSTGAVGSGYGVRLARSDGGTSNSGVRVNEIGAGDIASWDAPFQYGSEATIEFTVFPDGSITGTVTSGSDQAAFSFPPYAYVSSGANFEYDHDCNQEPAHRLDEITIDAGGGLADDFERPDSPTVGNGWATTTGNLDGCTLEIYGGAVSDSAPTGHAGIARPFPFTQPVTVKATVSPEGSGRYEATFRVASTGAVGSGYGVRLARSDGATSNSGVRVNEPGAGDIASWNAPFQYGSQATIEFTVFLDGSITGTVTSGSNQAEFSFPPYAYVSSGAYFEYDHDCNQDPAHRLEDITLGPPACNDGLDNDADGFTDYPADPACRTAIFTRENAKCQDGLDNEVPGDGKIDFDGGASANNGVALALLDPQCTQPWRNTEAASCGLGAELALLLPCLLWLRRRRGAAI